MQIIKNIIERITGNKKQIVAVPVQIKKGGKATAWDVAIFSRIEFWGKQHQASHCNRCGNEFAYAVIVKLDGTEYAIGYDCASAHMNPVEIKRVKRKYAKRFSLPWLFPESDLA